MNPATIWIAAGLVGMAAEMLAPGVFLLPVGAAAVIAGLAASLGLGWAVTWAVFVAAMAGLIGTVAALRRRRVPGDAVNAPQAGLIGAPCRALAFTGPHGRVALGDGTWAARATERAEPVAGAAMHVVGLDGTTLIVRQDTNVHLIVK